MRIDREASLPQYGLHPALLPERLYVAQPEILLI